MASSALGSSGPTVTRVGGAPGADVSMSAAELLQALRGAASVLDQHADALDRLASPELDLVADLVLSDVDGDAIDDVPLTDGARPSEPGPGADLAATLGAACDAAGGSDFSALCRGLGAGAADAARTATGERLAAFLSGMGDALRNADRADGARFALALEAGAERVTEGDDGAHPGCLLAVMGAAADGALAASDGGAGLEEVLVSSAESGLAELEQGPLVDAALSERGTVDAAAAGFLLVLDSLAAVVAGEPLPEPPRAAPGPSPSRAAGGHRHVVSCVVTCRTADIEAAADVETVVHELSDSVRFEVAGPRWTVHAVTALPGSVVEALAGAGALSEVHIALAAPVDS